MNFLVEKTTYESYLTAPSVAAFLATIEGDESRIKMNKWVRGAFRKTHKITETFVAICLVIEGILFIWGFGAQYIWTDRVSDFLSKNKFTTGYIFIATATLLIFVSVVGRLLLERRHLIGRIEIFEKCQDLFEQLATRNAHHDQQIFTRLFVNLRGHHDGPARAAEMRAAVEDAKNNIRDILNLAEEIFTRVTGNDCGVCVQIVHELPDLDKGDATITTLIRDNGSAAKRRFPRTPGHRVRDNSIHKSIFVDGVQMVCIDDLQAAQRAGDFYTSSKTWQDFYNAVLVTPIPLVGEEEPSMPRATFCVDNKEGGLGHELCKKLASELVWRLAVKLYRLDEMMRSLEEPRNPPGSLS